MSVSPQTDVLIKIAFAEVGHVNYFLNVNIVHGCLQLSATQANKK